MAPSYASVVAAVLGVLGVHVLATAIYRTFFGSLKDLPGPWHTKISNLGLTFTEIAFRQPLYIDSLLARYGPIVRLGPNTVAFMDAGAAKIVYNRFPKDKWYLSAKIGSHTVSTSMLEPAEHAVRRRGFAAHYTLENILRYQQDFQDLALLLVSHLNELGGRSSVDCLAMFQHLMVDVLGVSAYDTRIDATKRWCNGEIHEATIAIHDWPIWLISKITLPRWVWSLAQLIPGERYKRFFKSDAIVRQFAEESLNRMRAALDEGRRDPQDQGHLISRLMQYKMPDGNTLDPEVLVPEISFQTGAAVDTTSTSASYGLWALARHPDILRTLQTELDDAMPDGQRIPDATTLAALPYLNAVIKEVLRLYGAAPSSLPRVVPSTGQPLEVYGYKLPPGSTVTTQSYSVHRQHSVFEDPIAFKPERWLNESEVMKINYFPFGLGTRVCAGQVLATLILRIVFAVLVRNFDPVSPPQTNEESMKFSFAFVISPQGGKCDIVFVPRKESH
ncbi:cytochrome P450 [Auriculariales sp. MPI-PUGE-AT-0066]|nr:cytochrome P450 [Auriculariales sp. MPI-PUGE-AT-0066]